MKTLTRSFILFALCGLSLFGQTVTPSTTLCAAAKASDTSVCLSSTTGVANQTGLYIDNEYMTVFLSASQTLAATNAYVPVSRANRSGVAGPSAHNNGSVAWVALTPSASVNPGDNGFIYSTQIGDYGPCVRTSVAYLPHIWPDRSVIRDCNGVTGQWVNYSELGQGSLNGAVQVLTTNGAVTVASGTYLITKAGVLADTLAAPTAGTQDGMVIRISSSTANAHTLTATGLFQTGTASVNLATFAAQAGAGLTLMAYQGKWIVLYSVGITFS